jgi:hypothetical protein
MNEQSDDRAARAGRQALLAWAPAVAMGAVVLSISVVAEAGSRNSDQAAGVFPPWWSQVSILEAASRAGDITAMGAAPFVVVVRSSHGPAAPRLRAAGAFLSLNAGLAGLCGT